MLVNKRKVEKKIKQRDKSLEKMDADLKSRLRKYRKGIEKSSVSFEAKKYALSVAEDLERKYEQCQTTHEIQKFSTEAMIILGKHYERLEELEQEFGPYEDAIAKMYPAERIKKAEALEVRSAQKTIDHLDDMLGSMPNFHTLLSSTNVRR